MASAQATQSGEAASVTAHAASLEESVQALKELLAETHEISARAKIMLEKLEQTLQNIDVPVSRPEIVKLLLQTERFIDKVTIDEKYIEANADDLEEREVDSEELTVYTDAEGHEYGVDMAGMIERNGIKTYRAVRVV